MKYGTNLLRLTRQPDFRTNVDQRDANRLVYRREAAEIKAVEAIRLLVRDRKDAYGGGQKFRTNILLANEKRSTCKWLSERHAIDVNKL